jgi:hypothetical protein
MSKIKLHTKILLSFLVIFSLSGIAYASARTQISVCPSGCDYTDVRTAIQEAPEDAQINLKNGTYTVTNPIEISAKNVLLKGESKDGTVIRFRQTETGFLVNADEAWITNLTVVQQSREARNIVSITERPDGSRPTLTRVYDANLQVGPINANPANAQINEISGIYGKGAYSIRVRNTNIDGMHYGILLDSPATSPSNVGPFVENSVISNSKIAGFKSTHPYSPRPKFTSGIRFEQNTKFLNNNIAIELGSCKNVECSEPTTVLSFTGLARKIDLTNTVFEGNGTNIINKQKEGIIATNAIFVVPEQLNRLATYNLIENSLVHGCQNATGSQAQLTCNPTDSATFGTITLADLVLEQTSSTFTEEPNAINSICAEGEELCGEVSTVLAMSNELPGQVLQYAIFSGEDSQVSDWTLSSVAPNFANFSEDTYYLKTRLVDSLGSSIPYTLTRSSNDLVVDNSAPIQDITLGGATQNPETLVYRTADISGMSYEITYQEAQTEVTSGTVSIFSSDSSYTDRNELCQKVVSIFQDSEITDSTLACPEQTLGEGHYVVVFEATDLAGNTVLNSFNIDVQQIFETVAPNTQILTPESGQLISDRLITVSGNSTDNLSGVKNLEIYLAPYIEPIEEVFNPELLRVVNEPEVVLPPVYSDETPTPVTEEPVTEPTPQEETPTVVDAPEAKLLVADLGGEEPIIEERPIRVVKKKYSCGEFELVQTVNSNKTSELTEFSWSTSIQPATPGSYCIKVVTNDFATPTNTSEDVLENVGYDYQQSSSTELLGIFLDEVGISSFTSTNSSYSVELPFGTTTHPVVIATTTDERSTVEITAPESFPGVFTILVTAENGNTQTYTVTFTIAEQVVEPETPTQRGGASGSRPRNPQTDADIDLQSVGLASSCAPFTDITGNFAVTQITELYNLGVVCGDGLGNYRPNDNITRAEMSKITAELFDIPTTLVPRTSFSDITSTNWFTPYIYGLTTENLIAGFPDGTFKPFQSVTRAEALQLLLNAKELELTTETPATPFTDVTSTDWFYSIVNTAVASGVITGYEDGTFKPNQLVTRAEMAKIAILVNNL